MDKSKLKLIVHNMELLINALKDELKDSSDEKYQEICSYIDQYEPDYYEEED